MISSHPRLGRLLAAGVLAAPLALAGCAAEDDDYSDLRVIHASKDAPPVNVRVGARTQVKNLDYGESSGFVRVRSGTRKLAVEAIIPGGNADVIVVERFEFEDDARYTVLAVNDTADIEPLVVALRDDDEDDDDSSDDDVGDRSADNIGLTVVHAATAASFPVDVYLTGPDDSIAGIDPAFTFDFKDIVEAGSVPAGTYRIRVTGKDSKLPVYDSGPVDLSPFAGDDLIVAALSSVNSTEIAAAPIKLLAVNDITHVELLDSGTLAGARVVHLSPDVGTLAGPVEVFATSDALGGAPVELIDSFEYTDIVPAANAYVGVPSGDYVFDVAVDGTGIFNSVYTSPELALEAGAEYTAIAAGLVGGMPAFGLLATGDDNRAVVTQASVKVVHGAPAAGIVDVYVTPAGAFSKLDVESGLAGDPLLADFEFGTITDYVAVPPGDYDIRVVPQSLGVAAINIEGFTLPAGLVGTVIARQPDGDGNPADFGVVVLTN